jgi:hypothetical protein
MIENVIFHPDCRAVASESGVHAMALQTPPRLTTPRAPAGPPSSPLPDASTQLLLLIVAGLSAGAAGIHFAVAPAHLAEQALEGYFFVGVAIAQALWAILVPRYPHRRLLAAGAAANMLVAGLWLVVRLRGLPIGDEPWTPEPFGFTDTVSASFEVAIAASVLLLLTTRLRLPVRRVHGPALAIGSLLVIITGAALLNAGMTP